MEYDRPPDPKTKKEGKASINHPKSTFQLCGVYCTSGKGAPVAACFLPLLGRFAEAGGGCRVVPLASSSLGFRIFHGRLQRIEGSNIIGSQVAPYEVHEGLRTNYKEVFCRVRARPLYLGCNQSPSPLPTVAPSRGCCSDRRSLILNEHSDLKDRRNIWLLKSCSKAQDKRGFQKPRASGIFILGLLDPLIPGSIRPC